MRRRLSGLLAALIASAGLAQAATEVEIASGAISLGNPLGRNVGSAAEMWNNCGSDRRLDGVDGITFAVPAAARGRDAKLTTSPASNDADVYWFDSNCRPVGQMDAAGTGNEAGSVPSTATSGAINLISGRDAQVKLVYIRPD